MGAFGIVISDATFRRCLQLAPNSGRKNSAPMSLATSATVEKLNAIGWRVLCIWECATRGSGAIDDLMSDISSWMIGKERSGEISGVNVQNRP